MMSDQQCSPVVRYWRKSFPSGGDGNKIKGRYAISAKIQFNRRKGSVAAFSGERGSNGEKKVLRHFLESGVQSEKRKC